MGLPQRNGHLSVSKGAKFHALSNVHETNIELFRGTVSPLGNPHLARESLQVVGLILLEMVIFQPPEDAGVSNNGHPCKMGEGPGYHYII